MKKHVDIVQAIRHPKLFGDRNLPKVRRSDRFPYWRIKEAACGVGRRGGKSRVGALIDVFIGCFYDFKPYLAPGEVGMVLILARNRDQAGVVFGYVKGILENVSLAQMVTAWRSDEIELNNGITIKVATSDFRGVRGSTCVAAICDEVAFWNFDSDSANPDTEVLRAVRPAMATIPNSKLILISTGYAMAGALYDLHRQHFGKNDSPVLINRR